MEKHLRFSNWVNTRFLAPLPFRILASPHLYSHSVDHRLLIFSGDCWVFVKRHCTKKWEEVAIDLSLRGVVNTLAKRLALHCIEVESQEDHLEALIDQGENQQIGLNLSKRNHDISIGTVFMTNKPLCTPCQHSWLPIMLAWKLCKWWHYRWVLLLTVRKPLDITAAACWTRQYRKWEIVTAWQIEQKRSVQAW